MWPFKKWGVFCVIADEREGGGIEVSFDLARRWIDKNNPGKIFYQIKKRKVITQPIDFDRLIPTSTGKKALLLYGVSHDELYPIRWLPLHEIIIQSVDQFNQPLFFKTKPIYAKEGDKQLYYAVTDDNNPIYNETTTEKTDYPIITGHEIEKEIQQYQATDDAGNLLFYLENQGQATNKITTKKSKYPVLESREVPIITTEKTEYPVTEKVKEKVVTPIPTKMRFWLARMQEEREAKYTYKSWFDKYGAVIIFLIVGIMAIVAVNIMLTGMNQMLTQIDKVTTSLSGVADSLRLAIDKLSGTGQLIK